MANYNPSANQPYTAEQREWRARLDSQIEEQRQKLARANSVLNCILRGIPDDAEELQEIEAALESVRDLIADAYKALDCVEVERAARREVSVLAAA